MSRTVVVIGGGYGGSAVAKALDADADVVLVDPRDAFVNNAGSLRALTQPDWAHHAFFSYDTRLSRGTVVRDRVTDVDPGGVTLSSGHRIDADYLVLATGSSHSYPAKPRSESTNEALDDLRRTHKELRAAQRVLILGAGPVGLELAGEIREIWADKQLTIVDPAEQLLPDFLPEVREDLHRQLEALSIDVRLGTDLIAPPATEPGVATPSTVTTSTGEEITADIWFRAFGVRINSDYLAGGRLAARNSRNEVSVTDTLNVVGYDHVYAVGDLTDLAEAKMAGNAMQHAEIVAQNIAAQLRGERATATYRPAVDPFILMPLGPRGGVGQLPTPDGPAPAPAAMVADYKGADLFTGRFAGQFAAG